MRGPLLAFLLLSCAAMAHAKPPALPPPVPDRIGRAQIFTYKIADERFLIGKRDVVWGATGRAAIPGLYSMAYSTGDRDLDTRHDLAWYRAHHPGWIVNRCGSATPAWEFDDTNYVPIDMRRPDVRAFHWETVDRPALRRSGYYALAVDNIDVRNVFYRCPANAGYSAKADDPRYAADVAHWLDWLGAKLHASGRALAVNLYYAGTARTAFLRAARSVDIVVDEHGFVRKCTPMVLGDAWVDRIRLWREVARRKALIIIDQVCAREQEITPAALDWSLASYLMVKGNRSYLSIVTEDGYDGRYVDRPILDLPIGRALGEPRLVAGLWVRRFARAIAVTNPGTSLQHFTGGVGWRLRDGSAAAMPLTVPPGRATILIR